MEDKETQIAEMAKNKAMLILDMPNTCSECLFLDDNGDYPFCTVTGERRGYNFKISELKMDKCPLKEFPKGSIVLSGEQCAEIIQDNYNIGYERGIKETAESLLNELYYIARFYYGDNSNILAWVKDKTAKLGVKIKE